MLIISTLFLLVIDNISLIFTTYGLFLDYVLNIFQTNFKYDGVQMYDPNEGLLVVPLREIQILQDLFVAVESVYQDLYPNVNVNVEQYSYAVIPFALLFNLCGVEYLE